MLLCGLFMIACWPRGLYLELAGAGRVAWPPITASRSPSRNTIRGDEYRVRAGDTLYGIAWQKGIDYRSIAAWNGIRSPAYRIYRGSDPASGAARFDQATTQTGIAAGAEVQASTQTGSQTIGNCTKAQADRSSKAAAFCTETAQLGAGRAKGRVVSSFKSDDPLRKGIKIAGRSGDPMRGDGGRKSRLQR